MSDWLTAREIAALRLPGIAHTARGVNMIANRQDWAKATAADGSALARRRQGKGGGFEFHVSLLPQLARSRLEARAGRQRSDAEIGRDLDLLKARDVTRRDARLFVLARADEFARAHPDLNLVQALDAYAAGFTAKSVEVPDWVRAEIADMSGRTLRRWRQFREQGRLDLVAGRHSVREGAQLIERLLDGEVATFIGALIVKQPFLTASHIRTMVAGKYAGQLAELPSERTFQRFISEWKENNALNLLKLTNPDGFKSKARLSGANSNAHVKGLNQLWEIDASPADVLTTDGRHSLYLVIDIFSRRVMILVTKTPRTEATLSLIRRAILAWGVPLAIKTDNGSDFTSKRFVQAMNAIGIAHETSDAFSPEQKGTVERAIGTLQRDLMPTLPGFTGHSVADRKIIENRKAFSARLGQSDEHTFHVDISAAELQLYCDEWAANRYAHAKHAGIANLTPFAKAQSWTGPVKRIENGAVRGLDLLLAPIAGSDGWRQASKRGIQLDQAFFISPYLMPGSRYFCRHDPEDMGSIYCFESEAGSYVCTAICPDRMGIDPRAAVKAAREKQAEMIAENAAAYRQAARAIKPRDMISWMQAEGRARASKIAAFPHKTATHSSAALAAATDATSGGQDKSQLPPLPMVPAATATPQSGKIVQLPESDQQRFARAMRLEAMLKAGDAIDPDEAAWLLSYATTAKYRAFKGAMQEFGEEFSAGMVREKS